MWCRLCLKQTKRKNGLLLRRYFKHPRYTETERVFFMLYYYILWRKSFIMWIWSFELWCVLLYPPFPFLISVIPNNTIEKCNSLSMQMSLKFYPRALLHLKILTRAFSESEVVWLYFYFPWIWVSMLKPLKPVLQWTCYWSKFKLAYQWLTLGDQIILPKIKTKPWIWNYLVLLVCWKCYFLNYNFDIFFPCLLRCFRIF